MIAPWSGGKLFSPERVGFAAQLYNTCPFTPLWGNLLRTALYDRSLPLDDLAWSLGGTPGTKLEHIMIELRRGVTAFALALAQGCSPHPAELEEYRGAALFVLWEEYAARLQRLLDKNETEVPFYDAFVEKHRILFAHLGHTAVPVAEPAHLLALFYQVRRVWYFAATKIFGRSLFAEATRQTIWYANLSSDLRIYAGSLYDRVDQMPVLITGETGTGKDLAAQRIGWSRYIPFDPTARRFARKYNEDFHARSLCEVSSELFASTLFGHKRGSFTGATADATGFFALPGRHGSLEQRHED